MLVTLLFVSIVHFPGRASLMAIHWGGYQGGWPSSKENRTMRLSKWVGLAVVAAALGLAVSPAEAGFKVTLTAPGAPPSATFITANNLDSFSLTAGNFSISGGASFAMVGSTYTLTSNFTVMKAGGGLQTATILVEYTDAAGTPIAIPSPASFAALSDSGSASGATQLAAGEIFQFQAATNGNATMPPGTLSSLTLSGSTYSGDTNAGPGTPAGPLVVAGNSFTFSSTTTITLGDNRNYSLTNTATMVVRPVPEPATIGSLLALLPAAGIVALRRRARKQA
jgi:hypothetical protein